MSTLTHYRPMQAHDVRRGRTRASGTWPWVLAALAVAVQSAAHLTNAFLLGGRYRSLDAAVDASVFGRANSLAIGLSAALVALAARRGRRRASRLLLSGCLFLVMVDDATGFHDRSENSLSANEAVLGLAIVCLLALTAWLLLREAALASPATRLLLVVGLSALASAVVVRLIAAASGVGASLDTTTKALGVACEQGLDFGGWVLVATGLLALLAREGERSGEEPPLSAEPQTIPSR
jgi:hypothetical protein